MNGKEIKIRPTDKQMCALAFKVIYDHLRGPIVFVRVYSGILEARSTIRIASSTVSKSAPKERATKLLELYADDYEEISQIEAGNIGAILGLKAVKTGDTILIANDMRPLICQPITIPPPVFVRSIEPMSTSDEKVLSEALENLLREDPSLTLQTNAETGQLLISGMGELHLEIAGERLLETYNVKCKLGKVEISYRETMIESGSHALDYVNHILGTHQQCYINLKVESIYDELLDGGKQAVNDLVQIIVDDSKIPDSKLRGYASPSEIKQAIIDGIEGSVSRGPLLGYPLTHLRITLLRISLTSPETSTLAAIRAAAQTCLTQILAGKTQLLEPIMQCIIHIPQQYVGNVTRDLSGVRRGNITNMDQEERLAHVSCRVPLAELIGYASGLRGMTAGTGEWTMELSGYELIPLSKKAAVMASIRGY